MKNDDLVSVIITTYNRPLMLMRACESVFKQDYTNIEIIIVDDNSPQDISHIISHLKHTSPFPIIYHKNESNEGACTSRNNGIQIANGHFITGLDDDDEFTPNRVSYFISNYDPQYSFICSNAHIVTKKGSYLFTSVKHNREIFFKDMQWANICGTQVFIEKSRIQALGGFDPSLTSAQDADMWLRLIEEYGKALRLKLPTFILHTEHEAKRISDNKSNGMQGMLEKHQNKMTDSQIRWRKLKIKMYNKQTSVKDLLLLCDLSIFKYLLKEKVLQRIAK